jgi:SAM-dependent methyltransferase
MEKLMRAGEVDKDRMLQVADHWRKNEYYARAERQDWLDPFWSEASPFRAMFKQLDGSCMVELGCGHGRHAAYVVTSNELPRPSRMILMDVNPENVDYCRQRFSADVQIQALQNNGIDFAPLKDSTISSIYCFDAMVHFEYDCVISYLRDAFRVLQPGSRALFHHSNYMSPGSIWLDNPHCRNFMSRDLFAHVALRAGFRILDQVVLDWGEEWVRVAGIDCLSMIEKPAGVEPPSPTSLLRRIAGARWQRPGT